MQGALSGASQVPPRSGWLDKLRRLGQDERTSKHYVYFTRFISYYCNTYHKVCIILCSSANNCMVKQFYIVLYCICWYIFFIVPVLHLYCTVACQLRYSMCPAFVEVSVLLFMACLSSGRPTVSVLGAGTRNPAR